MISREEYEKFKQYNFDYELYCLHKLVELDKKASGSFFDFATCSLMTDYVRIKEKQGFKTSEEVTLYIEEKTGKQMHCSWMAPGWEMAYFI